MAYVPQILAVGPGSVEIGTAIKLPTGKFLRDALRLDAEHLEGLADALDAWNSSHVPAGAFKQGSDALEFVYGGTDWEPRVILVNLGPNGGSLSLVAEDVPKLVEAIREAARRGVGQS